MESGIFDCPPEWGQWLPPGTWRIHRAELYQREWDLLALTPSGCEQLGDGSIRCRRLLMPGDRAPEILARLKAETVVAYGLSPRDSLTLSSLREPVLCVQRALPGPGGTIIEPQELPLPSLPFPAEELLPLLGLRLLRLPLTEGPFWGKFFIKRGDPS